MMALNSEVTCLPNACVCAGVWQALHSSMEPLLNPCAHEVAL